MNRTALLLLPLLLLLGACDEDQPTGSADAGTDTVADVSSDGEADIDDAVSDVEADAELDATEDAPDGGDATSDGGDDAADTLLDISDAGEGDTDATEDADASHGDADGSVEDADATEVSATDGDGDGSGDADAETASIESGCADLCGALESVCGLPTENFDAAGCATTCQDLFDDEATSVASGIADCVASAQVDQGSGFEPMACIAADDLDTTVARGCIGGFGENCTLICGELDACDLALSPGAPPVTETGCGVVCSAVSDTAEVTGIANCVASVAGECEAMQTCIPE